MTRIGLPSGPRTSSLARRRTCGRAGRCGRSRCRGRWTARAAARAGVAGADLGGLDGAVGVEVTAGDHVRGVLAGLVGAGHPGGAGDHARVDQVADPPP